MSVDNWSEEFENLKKNYNNQEDIYYNFSKEDLIGKIALYKNKHFKLRDEISKLSEELHNLRQKSFLINIELGIMERKLQRVFLKNEE